MQCWVVFSGKQYTVHSIFIIKNDGQYNSLFHFKPEGDIFPELNTDMWDNKHKFRFEFAYSANAKTGSVK